MAKRPYDPSWSANETMAVNLIGSLYKDMIDEILLGIDKVSKDRGARNVSKEIRRFGETDKDMYRFIMTNQSLWDYLVKRLFADFGVPTTVPIHVNHMDVTAIYHLYNKFLWRRVIPVIVAFRKTYRMALEPLLRQFVADEFENHHPHQGYVSYDFFFFLGQLLFIDMYEYTALNERREKSSAPQVDTLCYAFYSILGYYGKTTIDAAEREAIEEKDGDMLDITTIQRMYIDRHRNDRNVKKFEVAWELFLKEFHEFYLFYCAPKNDALRMKFYANVAAVFQGQIDAMQLPDTADAIIVPLQELPDTYRLFWFLVNLAPQYDDDDDDDDDDRHQMFHATL